MVACVAEDEKDLLFPLLAFPGRCTPFWAERVNLTLLWAAASSSTDVDLETGMGRRANQKDSPVAEVSKQLALYISGYGLLTPPQVEVALNIGNPGESQKAEKRSGRLMRKLLSGETQLGPDSRQFMMTRAMKKGVVPALNRQGPFVSYTALEIDCGMQHSRSVYKPSERLRARRKAFAKLSRALSDFQAVSAKLKEAIEEADAWDVCVSGSADEDQIGNSYVLVNDLAAFADRVGKLGISIYQPEPELRARGANVVQCK